jgi:hypothetical protein
MTGSSGRRGQPVEGERMPAPPRCCPRATCSCWCSARRPWPVGWPAPGWSGAAGCSGGAWLRRAASPGPWPPEHRPTVAPSSLLRANQDRQMVAIDGMGDADFAAGVIAACLSARPTARDRLFPATLRPVARVAGRADRPPPGRLVLHRRLANTAQLGLRLATSASASHPSDSPPSWSSASTPPLPEPARPQGGRRGDRRLPDLRRPALPRPPPGHARAANRPPALPDLLPVAWWWYRP